MTLLARSFPQKYALTFSPPPLVWLMLVALALRLLLLGNAALWYDESGSVWMASLPFERMLQATGGDVHPPLYLALLWVWVRMVGVSEFMVRLPSVIISVLALPLAWKIGERLGLKREAVIAGVVLLTLAPVQLHYAQEARMYALMQFEFLLGLYGALSRRWWIFGVSIIALLYTQNLGAFFIVILNVVAVIIAMLEARQTKRGTAFLWIVWCNIAMMVLYLPWLSVLRSQVQEVGSGWWAQPISFGSVMYVLYMLFWTYSTPDALQAHAALLLFAALSYAIGRAIVKRDRAALILCLLMFTPIMFTVVASVAWHPVLLFRALMPVSPMLCLLLGWALVDGVTLRGRLAASLFAAPLIATCLIAYFLFIPDQKGGVKDYLNAIEYRAGDVIYYVNEGPAMAMHFYTPPSWTQVMMPPPARNLGSLTETTRRALGFDVRSLADVTWTRAWVIRSSAPTTTLEEDAAVDELLKTYTHQVIVEHTTDYTHQAVYLLWNKNVGVP